MGRRQECTLALVIALASACAHSLHGADPEVAVDLPADHAAHGDAQTEWWHFHGHMTDADGRRYDWFLAFISQHTDRDSLLLLPVHWFVDPLHVAYFTVTDHETGEFVVAERHAFPDTWAASASHDRLALRHNSFTARRNRDGTFTVSARARRAQISFTLRPEKPAALLGQDGYLHVPPRSSHYYYSIPRMSARGELVVGGERREVTGAAWFKHEWGFLYDESLQGWVWFGVQLDSGVELEIGLIFDREWNLHPGSFAVVEERDGSVTPIEVSGMEVRQLGEIWRSPRTDVVYPTNWLIDMPGRGGLILTADVPNQEMVVFPANLWAGGLTVKGDFDGEQVAGDCFAEVVGLDQPFGRSLLRSGGPRPAKGGGR